MPAKICFLKKDVLIDFWRERKEREKEKERRRERKKHQSAPSHKPPTEY